MIQNSDQKTDRENRPMQRLNVRVHADQKESIDRITLDQNKIKIESGEKLTDPSTVTRDLLDLGLTSYNQLGDE